MMYIIKRIKRLIHKNYYYLNTTVKNKLKEKCYLKC